MSMTKSEAMISAHKLYNKEVQKLKSFSPEWKPISFKKYIIEHQRKKQAKGSFVN